MNMNITPDHKRVMSLASAHGNVDVIGIDCPDSYDPPLHSAQFLCAQLVRDGYLKVHANTRARENRKYDVVMAFVHAVDN